MAGASGGRPAATACGAPRRARARPGGARRRRAACSGRARAGAGPARRPPRGCGGGAEWSLALWLSRPLGDLAGDHLEAGEDRPGPGAPLALAEARAGGEGARGAQCGGAGCAGHRGGAAQPCPAASAGPAGGGRGPGAGVSRRHPAPARGPAATARARRGPVPCPRRAGRGSA